MTVSNRRTFEKVCEMYNEYIDAGGEQKAVVVMGKKNLEAFGTPTRMQLTYGLVPVVTTPAIPESSVYIISASEWKEMNK